MAESPVRKKTARQLFDQVRSIGERANYRGARYEQAREIADRYAANIRSYLGENYSINTPVSRDVYMGLRKRNNR